MKYFVNTLTAVALVCSATNHSTIVLRNNSGTLVAMICNDDKTSAFDWPAIKVMADAPTVVKAPTKTGDLDSDIQALAYIGDPKWYANALIAAHKDGR